MNRLLEQRLLRHAEFPQLFDVRGRPLRARVSAAIEPLPAANPRFVAAAPMVLPPEARLPEPEGAAASFAATALEPQGPEFARLSSELIEAGTLEVARAGLEPLETEMSEPDFPSSPFSQQPEFPGRTLEPRASAPDARVQPAEGALEVTSALRVGLEAVPDIAPNPDLSPADQSRAVMERLEMAPGGRADNQERASVAQFEPEAPETDDQETSAARAVTLEPAAPTMTDEITAARASPAQPQMDAPAPFQRREAMRELRERGVKVNATLSNDALRQQLEAVRAAQANPEGLEGSSGQTQPLNAAPSLPRWPEAQGLESQTAQPAPLESRRSSADPRFEVAFEPDQLTEASTRFSATEPRRIDASPNATDANSSNDSEAPITTEFSVLNTEFAIPDTRISDTAVTLSNPARITETSLPATLAARTESELEALTDLRGEPNPAALAQSPGPTLENIGTESGITERPEPRTNALSTALLRSLEAMAALNPTLAPANTPRETSPVTSASLEPSVSEPVLPSLETARTARLESANPLPNPAPGQPSSPLPTVDAPSSVSPSSIAGVETYNPPNRRALAPRTKPEAPRTEAEKLFADLPDSQPLDWLAKLQASHALELEPPVNGLEVRAAPLIAPAVNPARGGALAQNNRADSRLEPAIAPESRALIPDETRLSKDTLVPESALVPPAERPAPTLIAPAVASTREPGSDETTLEPGASQAVEPQTELARQIGFLGQPGETSRLAENAALAAAALTNTPNRSSVGSALASSLLSDTSRVNRADLSNQPRLSSPQNLKPPGSRPALEPPDVGGVNRVGDVTASLEPGARTWANEAPPQPDVALEPPLVPPPVTDETSSNLGAAPETRAETPRDPAAQPATTSIPALPQSPEPSASPAQNSVSSGDLTRPPSEAPTGRAAGNVETYNPPNRRTLPPRAKPEAARTEAEKLFADLPDSQPLDWLARLQASQALEIPVNAPRGNTVMPELAQPDQTQTIEAPSPAASLGNLRVSETRASENPELLIAPASPRSAIMAPSSVNRVSSPDAAMPQGVAAGPVRRVATRPDLQLSETARQTLRQITGLDPNEVSIRRDPHSEALTRQHGADGLAVGETIHLSTRLVGETPETLGVIAHELTHVVRGRQPRFVPPVLQADEPRSSRSEEGIALAVEGRTRALMSGAAQPASSPAPSRSASAAPLSAPDAPWQNSDLPAPWQLAARLERAFDPDSSGPEQGVSARSPAPASIGAPSFTTPSAARAAPSPATYTPMSAPVISSPSVQAAAQGRDVPAPPPPAGPLPQRPETAAVPTGGAPKQDLDDLARQIYGILKRRLITEGRRRP